MAPLAKGRGTGTRVLTRPATNPLAGGGVTCRSLLAGAVVAALLGVAAPYEHLLVFGSPLHLDYSTPAAVFFFLLFLLIVNPAAALLRWRWRFSGAELATVYVMAAVACTLPTNGLVCRWLPFISSGAYYATAENGWGEEIVPAIPEWLRVTDPEAIKWFYEGLPEGMALPWQAWAGPLLAWAPMLLAAYAAMTGDDGAGAQAVDPARAPDLSPGAGADLDDRRAGGPPAAEPVLPHPGRVDRRGHPSVAVLPARPAQLLPADSRGPSDLDLPLLLGRDLPAAPVDIVRRRRVRLPAQHEGGLQRPGFSACSLPSSAPPWSPSGSRARSASTAPPWDLPTWPTRASAR